MFSYSLLLKALQLYTHFVFYDLEGVFHFSTYGTEGKYWIGLFCIGLILLPLKTAEVFGISGKRIKSLLLNSTAKCFYNVTL